MPQFAYVARDRTGKKRTGQIQSNSKNEAYEKVRAKELRVVELKEVQPTLLQMEINLGNPVKLKDFVIYLRQFATLLEAGVTVVEATRILSQQTESKGLRRILQQVEADIRGGIPLSTAYGKHPKAFSPLFLSMIKAGEATGDLDGTLNRMGDYYEKQFKTQQKIKSAMMYPIVLLILASLVVTFLLIAVVPTFVDMFKDFDAELPAITVWVLDASDWMKQFWWVLGLGILGLYICFTILLKNRTFKNYMDYAILKVPIFGKLLQKAALARLTRTLSSLISSSVPILSALSICENVVGNGVMTKVLVQARQTLEKGGSLAGPMREHWVFPPLVSQMVTIGENTGSLDSMLAKVADFYETEVETMTDQLKALIEPLMIVILAAIVGVIVLAIMIPMFSLYENIM